MQVVKIHSSGAGADKFEVTSYGNGTSYNFSFGEAGSPMRNLFFQGDDATTLRDEFDILEDKRPDDLTRDLWIELLDPYL